MPFLPFLTYLLEFQFTHPRGVRLSRPKIARSGVVSIHAPARGAMNLISYLFHNLWFQFTHPRGVRYVQPGHARYNHSFNSRTREGCDYTRVMRPFRVWVSIHAPARGAMGLSKRLVIKGLRKA